MAMNCLGGDFLSDKPVYPHLADLLVGESKVHHKTLNDFEPQVDLVRRLLDFILEALGQIGDVPYLYDARTANVLLANRSFNSLRCAFDQILRGYYVQSFAQIRAALEDWFACQYFKAQPERAADLFPNEDLIRTSKMADIAGVRHIYDSIYQEQSLVTHPRRLSIRMLLDSERKLIRLGGNYDKLLALGCFYQLVRGIVMSIESLAYVISGTPAATIERGNTGAVLQREAHQWLDEVASE